MELYLHIPFCVRKCAYCDFLSFPAGGDVRQQYVDKLTEEIRACGKRPEYGSEPVETVFVGGGTPSLLTPGQMDAVMAAVHGSFHVAADAEITAEANPGAFDRTCLEAWKKAGISRISLGLQSIHEKELACLGRIHTFRQFEESFRLCREAGFDNLNVDLMSALPGQTEESWEETLRKTAAMKPEHISAYSLIIEEGTPFYEIYGKMEADLERYGELSEVPESHRRQWEGVLPLPGEEADRTMYHRTKEILREAGYERYEISNYALPGRECRHNAGYWTGIPYLGLGLGASSLEGESRFHVTRRLDRYLSLGEDDFYRGLQYEDRENLTVQDRMEEFMFLGLRMIRGIEAAEFEKRFGAAPESVYGTVLNELEEEELLTMEGRGAERRYRLTDYGLDVSNCALARFLF